MDPLHVGALWLHAASMVLVLGYFAVVGLIVVPTLRRSLDGPSLAGTLASIEGRAMPFLVASVIVFTATGAYLLTIDERYVGIGDFSSTWSTLFLVKHVVVVLMIGLGLVLDARIVRLGKTPEPTDGALRTVSLAMDAMTVLGLIVLLLTAAAQYA